MPKLFLPLLFLFFAGAARAQVCMAPGQNPPTAFPVCGSNTFHQSTVPICGNSNVIVPGCNGDGAGYENKNPFWYKFTCYASGTLGFLITPANLGDDYDWELFDVTAHDPNDVFTDASTIVTANWAGTYGLTGASDAGVDFVQCASDPNDKKNAFAKMPQLVAGHNYLLLISHFTNSQSGYDLNFSGGTAVINDPDMPHLRVLEANCEGNELQVKLSKNIKCTSLSGNGSEFGLSGGSIMVTGARGAGCAAGFDSDSMLVQLSAPLPPGIYTLTSQKGTDGNTLLDYCDNPLPEGETLSIEIKEKQPTKMDSLLPVSCAPQQIHLLFEKGIRCTTIAADGSNFIVAGSYPVAVTAAAGICNADGLSKEIVVSFGAPLQADGRFTIRLQKDFDGNTIIDECGQETPEGSQLSFSVRDTVNAAFLYTIKYGCVQDTITVANAGGNGVNTWQWDLDGNQRASTPVTMGRYAVLNEKKISLVVSNGFCSDTATANVLLDNYIKAGFDAVEDNCPNESIQFNGTPAGVVASHLWEFGDGGTRTEQNPAYTYSAPAQQRTFDVRYTVTDAHGCKSSATKAIVVYPSCYVAVPTAFTPNGDGLNDYLAPLNAVKATNLVFRIYNRWGQLVYETANWKQGWDGNFKGQAQPASTYVWMLQYTTRDNGQKLSQKGTAVLIR